jgi:hypothetical protein
MDNEQLILLKDMIQKRITSIQSKRKFYRKMSTRTFIGTAILAAMSTILLGLHIETYANEIRIIVLVITSIISICATYNALFDYKDLWTANNEALNRFYKLSFDIGFYEKGTPPLDLTAIAGFKAEYQSILDDLNLVWQKSKTDNHAR